MALLQQVVDARVATSSCGALIDGRRSCGGRSGCPVGSDCGRHKLFQGAEPFLGQVLVEAGGGGFAVQR